MGTRRPKWTTFWMLCLEKSDLLIKLLHTFTIVLMYPSASTLWVRQLSYHVCVCSTHCLFISLTVIGKNTKMSVTLYWPLFVTPVETSRQESLLCGHCASVCSYVCLSHWHVSLSQQTTHTFFGTLGGCVFFFPVLLCFLPPVTNTYIKTDIIIIPQP